MARKLLPLILLTALTLCSARPGLSQTCGGQNVCTIKGAHGGTYYVVKPTDDSTVKPMKIFVFFHGHNGSGKSVLRNRRMIANLHRQGYLVVAPDGPQFRFNNRTTRGWAARKEAGEPRGRRDDIMFVENVLTTVAQRYQLEIADTVISGFSSGGSMAWYFSCYSKLPLGGIIAVAGGLRRPLPSNPSDSDKGSDAAVPPCPGGPRNVVHNPWIFRSTGPAGGTAHPQLASGGRFLKVFPYSARPMAADRVLMRSNRKVRIGAAPGAGAAAGYPFNSVFTRAGMACPKTGCRRA